MPLRPSAQPACTSAARADNHILTIWASLYRQAVRVPTMWTRLQNFLSDKRGATAIEYGLIAAMIAIGIIASAKSIGTTLSSTFSSVASNITTTK
jgi:pilus assembly protein Flp/PilA